MNLCESETIEFKEIYVDDIRKEIIAFANTSGGTLYVGIRDDGSIRGVDDPNFVIQQITNSVRDAVLPDITLCLHYDVLQLEAKNVVAVTIQRGLNKPYFLSAKGMRPAGVYVRQGTSCVPASNDAIRQMIRDTDGAVFEDMRSLEQELTFKEAGEVFAAHHLEFTKIQMRTLGIVDQDDIYTNLGLLLSDQCPHIIKAAIFQDTTQNAFQSRREFTGSLFKQLRDAYNYIDMSNNLRSTYSGLERIDKRDYPEAAVREALLNSIVHRDYSINASTLISIYTDRMEFVSIGGLLPGVQKQDVLLGLSVCRNRKLANIFYRLNLIEAYGTGLPKILGAYKQYAQDPQFITTPGAFKVILPNTYQIAPVSTLKVCEEQAVYGRYGETAAVTKYIREHPATSRAEIASSLGLSASKAVRILKMLREKQYIRTEGKGKNICYFSN